MENENRPIIVGQNKSQDQNIPKEFIDTEFATITEEIELPTLGAFYANGKKTVKIKCLTADEDDVLFSPELIKSGRVLDVLLQIIVIDKYLNPDDMIVGDRNAVLIHARRTGLGEEYKPGKMICPSCGESYEPIVDLSKLALKKLENMPDAKGEYDFLLPIMKKNIKFRLLNGKDENRISKASQTSSGQKGGAGFKISKGVTERYRLQIMEVEGNRDKIYISKLISAMPMKDSLVFREYSKLVSPGIDFNYVFECTSCGHHYEGDVPMTYRLFYPDANL